MEDEPRVAAEPPLHLLSPVDAQVVEHHMDVEFGRNPSVHDVHEREELLLGVLGIVPRHHLTIEDIESSEEIDRAIPTVVVRPPLGPVPSHR